MRNINTIPELIEYLTKRAEEAKKDGDTAVYDHTAWYSGGRMSAFEHCVDMLKILVGEEQ